LALAMKDSGKLSRETLVATVMSNLGLKVAMQNAGIKMLETQVGDRYVLEEMRSGGYALGGEQSGHIIFSQYATTGDGVLTGLQLAARVVETGKPLSEDKSALAADPELAVLVDQAKSELGEEGRVLLRASGTEALVRVMVEAKDQGSAQSWAERIANLVAKRLAL